ncbi:hypothetical protein VTL71DRAFT_16280 [Oculimacula yallundae]|uniref:NAD-dependent epimerase/dehydratase domain-containing protein n=1 Tax=Oculimacula yallundae TaxID=86028 RepID=A0ABR4CE05_9HELO
MKLSTQQLDIPVGSLVLVTGASGFVATHIVEHLLLSGYKVRGTVRDERKVQWTTELFNERHGAGKYSAVIVPDMSVDGAFDEAVKGTFNLKFLGKTKAEMVTFSPDPNAVIPESIAGVKSILRSAAKSPSVKTFVFTSSSVSCAGGIPGPNVSFSIDETTYNESAVVEAWSVTSPPFPPTHPSNVYGASKAEAEKAFWTFVKEENPHFKVNTIIPDANFGDVLSTQGSLSTGNWMRMAVTQGKDFVLHKFLPYQWYVNVNDTARLHVAALISTDVKNERIFSFAAPSTWTEIFKNLKNLYPDRHFADPVPREEQSKMRVPNQRGEQLLRDVFGRLGWVSLEETVAQNVKDLE